MLIAFTGYAHSGKTTCSNKLVKDYGFTKVNFKDALVDEMKDRLPDTLEALVRVYYDGLILKNVNDLFAVKPPAMRALMQNYGTDVRRRDDEKYWIGKWAEAVRELVENERDIVVDDCRFPNEADVVRLLGGTIVRIIRPDVIPDLSHASERMVDQIQSDIEISCKSGELGCLYSILDSYVEKLKGQ